MHAANLVGPEEIKKSISGPRPKKVMHHWSRHIKYRQYIVCICHEEHLLFLIGVR